MINKRFYGKNILIVGGNSGIGLSAAKLFAQEGANIIITGRNDKTLKSALNEIGKDALSIKCDVSSNKQIEEMASIVRSKFKNLDVLFFSAGQCSFSTIGNVTEEEWHWVMDANLKGLFFTVQAILQMMNNPSSIVLAGSVAGTVSVASAPVYGASKAGLRSLARSLAASFIDKGIRVNVVSPGPTDTPAYGRSRTQDHNPLHILNQDLENIPMKRLAMPEEVAKAVLFLASSDSSFTNGAEIFVDGGEVNLA
ncbi:MULTISPECIES: SDR family oxidoreductase [Acinetobacter]|uniref:SDR family oxidoreductase n=1 Tax=Acinetobacter TaxID=469 RepID=UPI0018DCD08C|nr:SDR family oxidoreductase [Acinetobacter seifertii]MDA4925056.1 SDR family oxidoreductase [Acinetobacter baumannii]MDV7427720.1 SDR family oxidoreductase [Acinetobacter baumannii]QPV60991.1 SDR family oxidoreductase [Acinetobacter seifertii]HCH7479145.1 SDR family oxidoreductase [Acinetobacter baumannii]